MYVCNINIYYKIFFKQCFIGIAKKIITIIQFLIEPKKYETEYVRTTSH